MKVAIVTDSTAYIPAAVREEWKIHMVPLNVVFGDESYREEIDIETGEFYNMVKQTEELPKTSQPAIGDVLETYESLAKEDYDAIVSIHLSSGISGTYQAAVSAGSMVEGINVHCFDSEISARIQGFYVMEAAEMAQKGASVEEILDRLQEMKQTMRAYFMVDDLSHLRRGGRLSGAQAMVGSMLQVKPVLHFVEGKIVPFEKVRTRKKAMKRIISLFEEDAASGKPIRAVAIHANQEQEAITVKEDLEKRFDNVEVLTSYIGPVIGTHLGEGSFGFGWYVK
ncbi:DegV family protein [Aquibacillus albus]|uniref:DegV family protein with EDD domain n=1 Tax=Aquibacillus albus TaxID=1168171 RepID=A0ABS2MWK9_9BACI|nr:DegV family protein [Aquibacillus albus]MBM7570252.1 DegV family protein with EDD domain [Aquibacillus albus]